MSQFANGENVLCFYGRLIYKAKCLGSKIVEDEHRRYLIHYAGWSKKWDEWVPESRIFKYNVANLQRQKELLRAHTEQQNKIKRKTDTIVDGNQKRRKIDVEELNQEYTCSSCYETFTSQFDLEKHMERHTPEANIYDNEEDKMDENETSYKYLCTLCNKKFLSQVEFDKHWQWHILQLDHIQSCCVQLNQVEIFKCDSCSSYFLDAAKLKTHEKKHFKEIKIMNVNETKLEYQSDLDKHIDRCVLLSKNEADIAIDKNEKNKVGENESNNIDNNETNKIYENGINNINENEMIQFYDNNTNENTTNKVDDNDTNKIDGNELNNYETNTMDENESNKIDENKTNELKDNVTNKVDSNKTNKLDENETNKMDQNETNKVEENESNIMCKNETNKFNNYESKKMEENKTHEHQTNIIVRNETNELNDNDTNKVGNYETNKLDEIETNKINENETNIMEKNQTHKFDNNETNQMVENDTNKFDKNEIKELKENKTNKVDENETNKLDENEIRNNNNEPNKINDNETNRIYKNETNKMDKNETNKIVENETNESDENKTSIITENETNRTNNHEINNRDEIHKNTIDQNDNRQKYPHGQFELNKHMQIHTLQLEYMKSSCVRLLKVKIFKCDFCTSIFPDKGKLRIHQKKYFQKEISTSQNNMNNIIKKNYECVTCGWGFVEKSTLELHSILHKPFPHVCECGIGYYQKHDLDGHRKLVHPNYKPPKPSPPKIKQEAKAESKSNQLQPYNKLGPRLKASPTFKQPKNRTNKSNKTNKRKPGRGKSTKGEKFKMKIKVDSQIKMELEPDENGNYPCTLCTRTFLEGDDLTTHLRYDHTEKVGGLIKCKICDYTRPASTCLKMHMMAHAGLKPYLCHICKGRYSQVGALKLHLLRHTGDRQFQCQVCEKAFYSIGDLRLHTRVHTGQKPYECKKCGKSFSDPSASKRHLLIHINLKPYRCEICPKAFNDPAALYRHNRLHQGYKVSCTECDRTFSCKDVARKHFARIHGGGIKEKFECDHCSSKFEAKPYLVMHMKNMHLNPGPKPKVKCEICNKQVSVINLKSHLQGVHLKITRFECDICGARFLYNYNLKKHKNRIHRPKRADKIFECDHCVSIFNDKSDLRKHITNKHLGITCQTCKRSFSTSLQLKQHKSEGCKKCSICNMAFRTPKHLEDHYIITHLDKKDQKMYECDYCAKEFPLKSRLLQHIHTHTQPKDAFRCDHCSLAFSSRSAIVYHIWDKHMISLYCNICLKRFYRECEFRRHKRTASCRLQVFQCEICDKKFNQMASLRVHLLYHGPKRVECFMCGDKFFEKHSLARHIKLMHQSKDLCSL